MAVEPPFDLVTGNHHLMTTRPQADEAMQREHLNAMMCPIGRESCIVDMIRGWLSFADSWGDATERCIGDDRSFHSAFAEWKAMGEALRGLLPKFRQHLEICQDFGDPACRLNFATLDRMIVAALEWQEIGTA